MLTQWARTYARGAAVMPAAAVLSAAGMFWLSLVTREERARGYLAAGLLTVGIVPYTILVMTGTNQRLRGLEGEMGVGSAAAAAAGGKEVGVEEERSAKGLVDWWGMLNLGRAGMLIAGVGCGLWATI
jgi:hypothetical protein